MVCGSVLSYSEKAEDLACVYCARAEHGHIICAQGHYICEVCHNRDAMAVIGDIVYRSGSGNAVEIAELAMSVPRLPMLGCHHAYIAGGSLMAAIKNAGLRGVGDVAISEVFKRTGRQAHGGYCGLTGVCGIAPAIGACFSVLTGSRCGTDEEQRIAMEAVTRVSRAIAGLTGPSCCKAYVWASLEAALDYLRESLGVELPGKKGISCEHAQKHPHGCRGAKCPYFGS